jgi:hypothetical protein
MNYGREAWKIISNMLPLSWWELGILSVHLLLSNPV